MKVCDNEVVGALVEDPRGRLLLITRATYPSGRAPLCGHRDDHGDWIAAAVAETFEEAGLTVDTLTPFMLSWMPNRCRRVPGPIGVGHNWTLFKATVTGDLSLNPEEASAAAWYSQEQLQELADRTVAYCKGQVPEEQWQADPGLEPAWVVLLSMPSWTTGWPIRVEPRDRAAVVSVAAGNPPGGPVPVHLMTFAAFRW